MSYQNAGDATMRQETILPAESFISTGSPLYRKVFISMLLGSTATFSILYSPQTLILPFAKAFDISPATASLIVSSTAFTLAISMLFVAVCSNALGRKSIMAIALISASILNILLAFTAQFSVVIVIRILQGIALSGFPAIAMTYLNEEIAAKDRGKVLAIYVGGTAIGAFIGRVIASTLTEYVDWQTALLLLGLLNLLCSIGFALFLPPSRHFARSSFSFHNWASGMMHSIRNKKVAMISLIGFVWLGVYAALFNYIAFPLTQAPFHLSHTIIGLLFICQLLGSWSSYVYGALINRWSPAVLLYQAIAMSFLGAFLTMSGQLVFVIIGLLLFASGFFAGHTVASNWILQTANAHHKTYASSLYFLLYYTGSGVIGWTGGQFLTWGSWPALIWMIGGLFIGMVMLVHIAHKQ